jgi:hypothetical protein
VILCGLCVESFSEFNTEDTEKSHRENRGLYGAANDVENGKSKIDSSV